MKKFGFFASFISVFMLFSIFINIPVYAASWTYGQVNITESFPDKVYIRWTGQNTQSCDDNDVVFNEASLGGAEAFERSFSIALTSTVSEKPIRFRLDGCEGKLQRATHVQLCRKIDCSY